MGTFLVLSVTYLIFCNIFYLSTKSEILFHFKEIFLCCISDYLSPSSWLVYLRGTDYPYVGSLSSVSQVGIPCGLLAPSFSCGFTDVLKPSLEPVVRSLTYLHRDVLWLLIVSIIYTVLLSTLF